jgi:hypothetical protein
LFLNQKPSLYVSNIRRKVSQISKCDLNSNQKLFASFKQISKRKTEKKREKKKKRKKRPRCSLSAQARKQPAAQQTDSQIGTLPSSLPPLTEGPTCHPVQRNWEEDGELPWKISNAPSDSVCTLPPRPSFHAYKTPPPSALVPLQNPRPTPPGCSKTEAAAPPQSDEGIVVSL